MGKACFIVNIVMTKIIRLVKLMIATERKVLVKTMKALTVIRRSYLQKTKISVSILERLICSSTVCKYCHESVSLIEDQQYSAVLARRFKIQCTNTSCQLKNPKPFIDMTRKSGQFYEVNRAFTLVCKLTGRGYSTASKITSVLNSDRSVSEKSWKKTYAVIDLICRTASNSKYE